MRIIPPGSGIVHQVNLEYLARVVFNHNGYFYPDSLVGTDSHTTMIDGLGVLGWGKSTIHLRLLASSVSLAAISSYKPALKPKPEAPLTDSVIPTTAVTVGAVQKRQEDPCPAVFPPRSCCTTQCNFP